MLNQFLIYEALISYLKDACDAGIPGRSAGEVAQLHARLDGYLLSRPSDNVVSGIVESVKCLKTLLELSANLGLTNNSKLRMALHRDGERIATLLVSIFTSKSLEAAALRLEGDSAQCFLDVVQNTLDKGFLLAHEDSRMARRIIRKLVCSSDKLPSALFITGITGKEEHPTFGGGFADIYRASYDNRVVALKYMRIVQYMRGSDLRDVRLKFCREALVWKELRHPHILPFLGIEENSFPSQLCMVSPWMEHGTVLNYLKQHGHRDVDKLLYEIAQGLQYLHSRDIVHGDLRGANILINEDWSACLADFGLSIFSDATSLMTTNRGGSVYWMAPELLDPDRFGMRFARTPASDVYAFGCVCLELYTGRPPFSGVLPGAMMKVINGERPPRPSSSPAMSDVLWSYVSMYWAQEPTTRPATQLVVQNMFWPPPPAAIKIQDLSLASASDPGSSAISEPLASVYNPPQYVKSQSPYGPSPYDQSPHGEPQGSTAYWTAVSSMTDNSTFSSLDNEGNSISHDPNINTILRKLYNTILVLEVKGKEEDNDETASVLLEVGDESERLKDSQKWKERIDDHKERVLLAETIYLLLQISLHPTRPVLIRAIPSKYNLIPRLWSSFHGLLESLRRASVASAHALEHLQDLFYHIHGFYTNLLEEPGLGSFKGEWLAALGHLARYKMDVIAICNTHAAIALTENAVAAAGAPADLAQSTVDLLGSSPRTVADSLVPAIDVAAVLPLDPKPEKELWRCIARDWYGAGVMDQPGQGRFHHYLGLLNTDVELGELREVYHFCKRSENRMCDRIAADTIIITSLTLQFPFMPSRDALLPMWSVDTQARRALPEAHLVDLFLLLHGMLFTDIRFDNFQATLRRFIARLETECVEERDWIMMSIVNVCAVLEYGNPAGVLRKATMSTDVQKGVHLDDWETDSHPAFDTPARAASSFSSALQLMFVMLSHVFRSPTLENGLLNPYLTVVLTFLATVLQYPQALAAMESSVPWNDLAAFFTRIPPHIMVDRGLSEEEKSSENRWVMLTGSAPLLPEDWCLQGLEWVSWNKVYSFELWKGGGDQQSEIEVLNPSEIQIADSADSQDDDHEGRWVRIVRCAADIAQAVVGFTWVEGEVYQWRVEDALAKKA
ncbi:PINc domain-containing protein [Mycena sanguinolenta]|uniref:PINc domain-containing protein n=1 Tax=Mycena sanguinolenta TaxID=230812 RepID=A0A8H7CM37_9AGAR|nr:PINc domain-containing protein [Mycena sanguinolenta]